MNKLKCLALLTLAMAWPASAQQAPKVEIAAGYSYLRLGGSGGTGQNGGSISFAGNVSNWFGFVGDFGDYRSSTFGASITTFTYMFGPRFSLRRGNVSPFVQSLFGGAHLKGSAEGISAGANSFASSVGGGVDLRVSQHIALRPQLDYIALRSGGETLNAGRASIGIVFRFGQR